MDPSAVRLPDGIEPISGYRCWSYTVSPVGVSLFPLRHFQAGPSAWSAWAGAESRWVEARCIVTSPLWYSTQFLREVLAMAPGADPALPVEDPPHEVPMEHCSCGFYAMRDLDRGLVDMSLYGMLTEQSGRAQIYVLGRVLLAGKVIEHAQGYRAERARIAELIPVNGTEGTVAPLAAALGLPMSASV
jgi:hypothetical protein